MKKFLLAVVIACAATSALAANVGVSVTIGDPNFYGQINIGDYPRPQVVYTQPVVIVHEPVHYEPIYLRVPPGHMKHWDRHCGEYNACGRPVYFVRDNWYNNEYAPRYRQEHRDEGHWREEDHGRGRDHDRHDDRGDEHDRGHRHHDD
ncbi:hypothetical protein [Andreprevotia chitinilytica]|uniref:hypothetical protein n=1 Tax=Andreprevotia chitinilytica TaxID=396808 RepID=UPI000550080A|nr:hypothetical protein [Andreprevotia chitinilytica]